MSQVLSCDGLRNKLTITLHQDGLTPAAKDSFATAVVPEDAIFVGIGNGLTVSETNDFSIGCGPDDEVTSLSIDDQITFLNRLVAVIGHDISHAMESQQGEAGPHGHRSIIGDHANIDIIHRQLTGGRIERVSVRGGAFFQSEGST